MLVEMPLEYREKINIERPLWALFLLFSFFPYLRIIPMPTDSQPYALVIGMLIISLKGFKYLKKELFYLFLVALAALAFAFVGLLSLSTIRSVINYVSLFVIATATYDTLRRHGNMPFKVFKVFVYIWLLFGLVQQFVLPGFGSFLISRMTEAVSSGRGVTSLAPEPTFYAIICALLAIISFLNFHGRKGYKLLMWLLFFQIFILSRSSTMILLVVAAFFIYKIILIITKKPSLLITLGLIVVVMYYVVPIAISYLSDYRIGVLLDKLIENPQLFVTVDESVNERFIHAFFPVYAFVKDLGMPHFYGTFADYMAGIYSSGDFAEYIPYYKTSYTRIMSGIGSALYELGVVAILIFIVICNCTCRLYKNNRQSLFWCILLLFILINAMPLSNALIGFAFGNLIYRKYYPLSKEDNEQKVSAAD